MLEETDDNDNIVNTNTTEPTSTPDNKKELLDGKSYIVIKALSKNGIKKN